MFNLDFVERFYVGSITGFVLDLLLHRVDFCLIGFAFFFEIGDLHIEFMNVLFVLVAKFLEFFVLVSLNLEIVLQLLDLRLELLALLVCCSKLFF